MVDELRTERVTIMMAPSELERVDDWSFRNRIRSRGEAIRRLIVAGMDTAAQTKTVMSAPPAGLTLVGAIIAWYRELEADPEDVTLDGIAVEDAVAQDVAALVSSMDFGGDVPPGIETALGHPAYVKAVVEWHSALCDWQRSRKKDKGAAPVAPALPE